MRRISFQEARKRFEKQGRTDIALLEKAYSGWKAKATFLDLVIDKEFKAIPHNVYQQRSCHPERAAEIRKQTNMAKYGHSCSLHGTTKAGKEVRNKTQTSLVQKYGTSNFFGSQEGKQATKKTFKKKYGVDNPSQLKKKLVKETGEYVETWLAQQPDPKPSSYQSFGAMYLFGKEALAFGLSELEDYLEDFRNHTTKLERKAEQLLEQKHYNKKVLSFRPDFKLSENLYVNVDGLYWHSEHQKDKWYHFNLRKAFEDAGLRIIQIREDEINDKYDIVRSLISHCQQKTSIKLNARDTAVRKTTQAQASEFLRDNHMMGKTCAKHIGLYDDDSVVALLSYKMKKDGTVKIERYCTAKNTAVRGGLSKLLAHVVKTNNPKRIDYWVDLRYGTGNQLQNLGFRHQRDTLGWKWTNGKETFNRLKCRANMDERKLSEKEYAKELGWYRIYDAGQRLWSKEY